MDEKDPGTVLSSITTSDDADDQDPAFFEEFSPLSSKEQEQEEEDEYVATLLAKEENSYHHHHHHHQFAGSDEASVQSERLRSIQWLVNSRARLGFGYRTAYLSIMYFDRFLSLDSTLLGRDWMIRLLTVTCLSLAVKMEEVEVPALSAYGGGRRVLTKFSFGTKWIKRMEFRVLNALQWRMRFISPFPFIPFFLRYLSFQPQLHIPSGDAVSRAAFIIYQSATVINTTEYTPSVTAMAATLLVMDPSLSKAAMTAKIASSEVYSHGFAATPEQVHSCYEMIKNQLLLDDKSPLSSSPRSSSSTE